jgi:uncharacterized protein with HEPN domain
VNRDDATLLDIARAATLVHEFVADLSPEAFRNDPKTYSAVQHQLLVLGKAVKRLSRGFRAQHPEIPWSLVAGMRDHLIHGYDTVDLDAVWMTATPDIPELIVQIPLLISELGRPPDLDE